MYFLWALKRGLGFFEGGSPSSAEEEERVAGFPAREASSLSAYELRVLLPSKKNASQDYLY